MVLINRNQDRHRLFVIFGGAGYIGRYLVNSLYQNFPECKIIVVTRNKSKSLFFLNYNRIQIIDNIEEIKVKNGIIFNLAFELRPSFRETKKITQLLIKQIFRSVDKQFNGGIIHLSSIAVNENSKNILPIPLKKIPNTDIYSYAKGYAENLLLKICRDVGIRLLVVRCGNVMGPGSTWAEKLIQRLKQRKPILGPQKEHPSNATFIGNLVFGLSKYALEIERFENDANIVNFAEFGNITWNKWVSIFSNYLNVSPISWPTDDISFYTPTLLSDLRYIKKEIGKHVIRLLNNGAATHRFVEILFNYLKASDIRKKAKAILEEKNEDYLDYQEYRAARIFLAQNVFGLEGNLNSLKESLPFCFDLAKKSIIGWLKHAGY